MKLYNIKVDCSGGGDFIVLADSPEEALDFIRPQYNGDWIEDDYYVTCIEREITEKGILIDDNTDPDYVIKGSELGINYDRKM